MPENPADSADFLQRLLSTASRLPEPSSLFTGEYLPKHFALPDNLLVFYHDYTAPAPNAHGRWTVVAPFDRMTYFLERQRISLSPGDLLVIHPHTMRYLHPHSEGYRRLFVTFELSAEQTYCPSNQVCHPASAQWRLFLQFLRQFQTRRTVDSAFTLYRLLSQLQEATPPEAAATAPLLPLAVSAAMDFIGRNLAHPFGNKEIADTIGISESHLRMLFLKNMGISLGHYVASQRLTAAQYRLRHTPERISAIAGECGFANVYVFSAFFKAHTGMPPLKYRSTLR